MTSSTVHVARTALFTTATATLLAMGVTLGAAATAQAAEPASGWSSPTAGVDVDFGAGVAITAPADGSTVPLGDLVVEVATQPGARLVLSDGDDEKSRVTATEATASLTVTGLTPGAHTLTVEQQSKGALITTSSIAVTVDDHTTPRVPFAITSPAPSDGYVSGRVTTFTGTAAAGADVSVTNKWGTSLGETVRADSDGDWVFARVMTGTSTYQIHVTETFRGVSTTLPFYGFAAKASPFAVTSPSAADGYEPGAVTTFTGTAAPHATIDMTNKWGTRLAPTVTADDRGVWTIDRVMTGTSTYRIVFTETIDGVPTTLTFPGFAPRS